MVEYVVFGGFGSVDLFGSVLVQVSTAVSLVVGAVGLGGICMYILCEISSLVRSFVVLFGIEGNSVRLV